MPAILLFSFFTGVGFHLFGDNPPTHCGIFVGMVEALTSVEIILRYTHNMLGLCGYGLGDFSDECNFLLFYLCNERIYTVFAIFFVCCVVRTMCDVFARRCQWTIKTLDHDTPYLRFSASPYTLQPYPSIYTCLHFSMDSYLISFVSLKVVFQPMTSFRS